jgi:tRNA pseudouridine32 synthase/23S rRNA pseudouridine746 synthase
MYDLVEKNADFIVVYKYPGVSFHREDNETGLFEKVKADHAPEGLFPVHRLDKVTSGLLVMARTEAVNLALCQQFAERATEKYYLAISDKKPSKKQGMIKGDMVKARRGAWKLQSTLQNPAITQFFSYFLAEGRRLFVLRPRTGKTHQLRVAMKSLGAPIVGDALYSDAIAASQVDRCYLHAYQLAFTLHGQVHRFQALPREGGWFQDDAFLALLPTIDEPQNFLWP